MFERRDHGVPEGRCHVRDGHLDSEGVWMGRDRLELGEEVQGEWPRGHPVPSVPTRGKGLGLGHVWHLRLICQ